MSSLAERPLAIVGMACQLPGADDLEEFWNLLIEGRTQLGELPPDRFDRKHHYDPRKGQRTKSYTGLGGVTSDRPFDRRECPIPQELIERSHKVHLKLCRVAAKAIRHAGLDPFGMGDERTGVYIGHTPPSSLAGDLFYARQIAQTARWLREIPEFDSLTGDEAERVIEEIVHSARAEFTPDDPRIRMRGNAHHAAALITGGFGLNGPSMSFDAACASSLRALGHAARALQLGQIDSAIVGGASYVHTDCLVLFSQAQSVSASGSRPFDDDADGLVAAEGYVAVVLKTLERAVADGDPIQAVIRGIGISSDGKGKSLWAPRKEGQIEAIRRAHGTHLSVADLQYIEMHATSTQVGDATEIGAVASVLREHLPAGRRIPIGSVKANVGHTLETAGLASLVKTVLSMQHGAVPPQIGIGKLNTDIDWESLPFYVPTSPVAWDSPGDGRPRRGALNAFGIGGLNVHVVLDEHVEAASRALVGRSQGSGVRGQGSATDSSQLTTDNSAHEPIAIVGCGAVLPGVRTIEALWDVLRSGEDQKREVPPERWDPAIGCRPGANELWSVPTCVGGFITDFEYDWKKHKVPPKQVATADPLQFMLLDAADQALADAGYREKSFDRKRTGVVVGTIFCGEFADQLNMGLRLPRFQEILTELLRRRGVADEAIARIGQQYEELLLNRMPALVDETGSFTASTLASRITKTFDLMGGATAVDAGDASSTAALACCAELLRAGDCDLMICAAGHRSMGVASYETLAHNGWLTRSSRPRGPFDRTADGGVPGEGVGVLLLKRLSDAERDGDKIHGIIRGIGAACEGSLQSAIETAACRSLEDAGVSAEAVSLVEAAAAGVADADREEAAALVKALGGNGRAERLLIGAAAGQFGKTGGASGAVSLIKAVAELNHVEMPRNVGLEEPLPEGRSRAVEIVTKPSRLPAINQDGRLYGGVNCYSQYNLAYHLIVEGMTRVPRTTSPPERNGRKVVGSEPGVHVGNGRKKDGSRVVRIGGKSFAELSAAAERAAASPGELFELAEQRSFTAERRARLAIVARSADEFAQKAVLAAKQIGKAKTRALLAEKGIFWGEPKTERPKVAFLFPGQGSQYTGMLRELIDEFPPARAAMEQVDAVLDRLNLPRFAALAWEDENPLKNDVWRTQLSLIAADTIAFTATNALGLRPDRVAGHSFGELAALVAAGAWTFEDAVRATCARCAAIDGCETAGVMLSTSAPADVLEGLCRQAGGRVYISHRNAPDQTVAAGEPESVQRLAELAARQGFRAKVLDVPAAFHTPLMDATRAPFGQALREIPLQPPRVPLLSSVTNRYIADPDDIRENLVVQMTRPVEYADLVERLIAEGVDALVEVGPRQVLTGLHKRVAGERPVTIIGCDHPKRAGLQQLVAARAALEVIGAFDPVDEGPVRLFGSPWKTEKSPPSSVPDGLTLLRLAGSPYEMGLQHGRELAEPIRNVLRRYADLAGTKWEQVRDLSQAVRQPEAYFGRDDLEELRGIAEGAGVNVQSLIAHNLRLYLDGGAGGLHFAITAAQNGESGLLHAANEDLRYALAVRDCLPRVVQVRRPQDGIASVVFGVPGQVGCLNGVNAEGVAVSAAALLDVPHKAASGRLLTALVRDILERAGDLDKALEIVRRAPRGGTWGLCLSHHVSDRLCYIEFDGENLKTQPGQQAVIAMNHRLLRTFDSEIPKQSGQRLERLRELLGGAAPADVAVEQAQRILRDQSDRGRELASPTLGTLRRIDNQISLVVQPATGKLWVTRGPLVEGCEDEFCELDLNQLLGRTSSLAATGSRAAADPRPAPIMVREEVISTYDDYQPQQRGDGTPAICTRFSLRMVPLEPLPERPVPLHGSVLILGENRVTEGLRSELEQRGAHVIPLRARESIDKLLAEIDTAWSAGPAPHLILATPFDGDAVVALDAQMWNERRERGVLWPYLVCQRWFRHVAEAKLMERASLVAVTPLGGGFGFSGDVRNIESGGLIGLVKAVQMEAELGHQAKSFCAKSIDAPVSVAPDELAKYVWREWAANDGEIEVGYRDGVRHLVRAVPLAPSPAAPLSLPRDGVLIVTGGARGVSAEVARELGRRYRLKLHLIGSSPVPEVPESYHSFSPAELQEVKASIVKEALANGEKPIEAWERFEKALEIERNLRSLAAAGMRAVYHSCDISDREALARVLQTIRADGPVCGIVHGAGYERAARFEKKQRSLIERTIAAKADGAAALMDLTRDDPLRFFVAFGSVSGRFGGLGQTDYCTANEMLSKLVDWHATQRLECRSTVLHWHAWDGVGMSVRPESKRIRDIHKINFMSPSEGNEHLIRELEAGLPESEVVITEFHFCRDRYFKHAIQQNGADRSGASSPSPTPPLSSSINNLPLLDALPEFESGKRLTAEVHLDPTSDTFLKQHRFRGRPLMPVVMTLEALAQAASLLAGDRRIVAVRDIRILNGFRFLTDEPQHARVHAVRKRNTIECDFTCDFRNRRGVLLLKDKPYLRAVVETSERAAELEMAPPGEPPQWMPLWFPEEEDIIWHGPAYRCLRHIWAEGNEGWGRLVAPPPEQLAAPRQGDGWVLPAALLDSCFYACGVVLWWQDRGAVAIPDGLEQVRLLRQPQPGEECRLHIRGRGRRQQKAVFDFVVFGEDGSPILAVDGYRNVIVNQEPAHVG